MSEDIVNSFELVKSSGCEVTSNSLELNAEGIASCLKTMECHFSDSCVEKQIDYMQTGQEKNEMILNGNFETLISDEDEEMVNEQYSLDTSDEDEHVDHRRTGQNRNVKVLDDQFASISSCSKSGEYNICDEIDNIATEKEGNETVVLDELDEKCGKNNLPPGWKKINHYSGMPIYFNEELKTCSFSKPYYIGTQSLKWHNVPIESIPCLDYKLKLEKKNSQKDDDKSEGCKTEMTPKEYNEYCKHLFKFNEVKCLQFSSWDKRRQYLRMVKADRRSKDLPKFKTISSVVVLPIDSPILGSTVQPDTGEFIINSHNKTYISVLQEYVSGILKTEISYTIKDLENARYPYTATVILNGIQYGIGTGSSKREAKLDSARASLEILLPSAEDQIKMYSKHGLSDTEVSSVFHEYTVFDKLKIKNPRIPAFCRQATELMPYDMLQICVKRNFGKDAYVETDMQKMQNSNYSENLYNLTMKVKNHMATVICKNKHHGQQKGAQALLKELHPHIKYFGSLLRLYSHQNVKSSSEENPDEPGTQSPQLIDVPNQDLLHRLRTALSKLKDEPISFH